MTGMEVRLATEADVDQIGRVHAVSRNAAYAGLVPADALARVTPQSQARAWRERLAEAPEPFAVHVVVVDGTVQGVAMGSADGSTATLHVLHVLPSLHGSGAGRLLHDAVVRDFARWECSTAELWVLEGNERAQAFYRRNGWAHDGGRDVHPVGGADVPILRYRRPVASP
jgi:GNAT superfamily N-acetyltransferase